MTYGRKKGKRKGWGEENRKERINKEMLTKET